MHFYSRHQSKFLSLERRQWPCLLFVHMTQRKTNIGLANVSIHGTSCLNQQRNSSSGLSQVSTTQVSRKLHQVSEAQSSYPQRLRSSSFLNFPLDGFSSDEVTEEPSSTSNQDTPPSTFLLLLLFPTSVHYLRLKDNYATRDTLGQDGRWLCQRVNPWHNTIWAILARLLGLNPLIDLDCLFFKT